MPIFDGAAKTITLDAPTGGVLNVDVQADLYSEWKRWLQADTANMKWNAAFRTSGGDDLTPGVQAGAYFFLRNDYGWRIISSDADQTINYSGNLVAENNALPIINVTPGRSVLHLGLQPVTQRVDELLSQQQLALYGGAVYIDTVNGSAGTSFPVGTASVPASNLADAVTIAVNNNFDRLVLHGAITLTTPLPRFSIEGIGTQAAVDFNGVDISDMKFQRCGVFGNVGAPAGGLTLLDECTVAGTITGFVGTLARCVLKGDIVLRDGDTELYDCSSGVAGANPGGELDGSALTAASNIVVRAYDGGIGFKNFTRADTTVTCGIGTGKINIRASCTNFADFQARGVAELNNQSAIPTGPGLTIDTDGLLQPIDVMLARKILQNRIVTDPSTGTITIYDDDDTPLLTGSIYEDAGGLTPYSSSSLGIERKDRAD